MTCNSSIRLDTSFHPLLRRKGMAYHVIHTNIVPVKEKSTSHCMRIEHLTSQLRANSVHYYASKPLDPPAIRNFLISMWTTCARATCWRSNRTTKILRVITSCDLRTLQKWDTLCYTLRSGNSRCNIHFSHSDMSLNLLPDEVKTLLT